MLLFTTLLFVRSCEATTIHYGLYIDHYNESLKYRRLTRNKEIHPLSQARHVKFSQIIAFFLKYGPRSICKSRFVFFEIDALFLSISSEVFISAKLLKTMYRERSLSI